MMNAEQYRALVNKLERINEKVTLNPDGTPPQTQQYTTPSGATFTGNAPTATAATPPPPAAAPAAAGPVKSQANYNMALQQIQSLYAKAQVAYPPQDDIIRQRFGLPPALPPFEQWDGKMPQAGEADFLTRNVLGRQASKDITQQNKNNTIQAKSGAQVDQNNIANVAKLKDLVAKLSATSAPKAAAPTATPGTPPASAQPAPAGTMTAESTDLRLALAKMLKEDFNIDMAEAGEDKQALIKQIQDLMAQINGDNENPEPEVAQALQDAQTAIDTANAAPAAAAPDTAGAYDDEGNMMPGWSKDENGNPVKVADQDGKTFVEPATQALADKGRQDAAQKAAIAGGAQDDVTGVDAAVAANAAAPQSGQAAPANQTFGQAFKAARASGAKEFDYKGKKYSTAVKGENPALDAAMKPKAPTAPTAPTAPRSPAAPAQSGQATPAAPGQSGQPPVMDPNKPGFDFKKASAAANAKKESVGYNEDQTLARIINLANIR